MISKTAQKQLGKYLLVGGSAFLVEYLSFLVLLQLSGGRTSLILAQTISFSFGLIVSYFGNRLFTFSDKENAFHHRHKTQLAAYLGLALFNIVATNLVLQVLILQLGLMALIAKVITMVAVAGWNFLIFRLLIFKPKQA